MVICELDESGAKVTDRLRGLPTDVDDIGPTAYPHGLTPPLKNVRHKRFRPTAKPAAPEEREDPKITRLVQRLLDNDNRSSRATFEVKEEGENDTQANDNDVANLNDLTEFASQAGDGAASMTDTASVTGDVAIFTQQEAAQKLNAAGLDDGSDSDDGILDLGFDFDRVA